MNDFLSSEQGEADIVLNSSKTTIPAEEYKNKYKLESYLHI